MAREIDGRRAIRSKEERPREASSRMREFAQLVVNSSEHHMTTIEAEEVAPKLPSDELPKHNAGKEDEQYAAGARPEPKREGPAPMSSEASLRAEPKDKVHCLAEIRPCRP
ncbi:MAG TPA: hypothetical protein VFE52_07550 [Devosia sp.]|nr:hypothetical protein [Devosia sp.]